VFGIILNRMILWELVKVFALSLVCITGILVMAGIVAEASQQGLGPAQVLAVIPLLVPSTLPYTIPATTLFASCVVYGRLAADNEILAIKAAGINILKVLVPALVIGSAASAATMGLYYWFIPHTHHVLRSLFLNDVEEFLYAMLRKEGQIKQNGLKYSMWVHRVQGRRLLDVVFKRLDEKGHYDVIAHAREAELWYVTSRGELRVHMQQAEVYNEKDQTRVHFPDKVFDVTMPPPKESRQPRPRELSWQQILERRENLRQEQELLQTQVALTAARLLMDHPPSDLFQQQSSLYYMAKSQQSEMNALDAELQMRPALSLGCLFFVLVGCPVGIWFSRSDYLSAFITCFLPIVCLYYPILLCGTNLAKDGKLPPSVAVWAANATVGVVGLWLFRRLQHN
jgi:lipopolysaccharide export system permease protein